MVKTCESCKFWIDDGNGPEADMDCVTVSFSRGECRKNAPLPLVTEDLNDNDSGEVWSAYYNQSVDTLWPKTRSYHWCGRYKKLKRPRI